MRPSFRLSYFAIVLIISAACAGGDFYYQSTTNIQSSAFVPSGFGPLAYYEDSRFAWEENQFIEYPSFNQSIVEDWEKYLGDQNLCDSLSNLILEDSLQDIIAFEKTLRPNQLSLNPKFKAFLDYLKLAKEAESYAISNSYNWWKDPVNIDSLSKTISDVLLTAWQTSTDDFIKSRLEFQIIRNSYFSANYLRGIDFYNRYVAKRPQEMMTLRSKSYAAGCYYKMGRYGDANAMYADIMAADKRFTQSMTYSFRPQEELDFIQTLKKCSNDESRICAWVMLAQYTGDAARAMREVRKLDANHASIDLLMSRQLAQYESLNFNKYYYEDAGLEKEQKINYLKINLSNDLKSLLEDVAYERKYKAHAASSYFYYLNEDADRCDFHLKKAFELRPKDDSIFSNQLRVFRVLLKAENPENYSTDDIADLQWVFESASRVWEGEEGSYRAYQIALQKLYKYLAAKNNPAADVLLPSMEHLKDLEKIQSAIAFLDGQDNIPLHDFIRRNASLSKASLYKLESMYYMKKGLVQQAYEAALKCENGNTFSGDPFSYRIKDCHDCDFAEYEGPLFTRSSFLREFLNLEGRFNDKASFEDAVLIGNAYYNLSYHGNLRLFYNADYSLHGYAEYSMESWGYYDYYWSMNYDVSSALKYYKKALELATTKEQKAQAYFLISKCELAEYYNNREGEDEADFISGEGFLALKEMEDSKFRKMVLQECGYFKSYFKNKN